MLRVWSKRARETLAITFIMISSITSYEQTFIAESFKVIIPQSQRQFFIWTDMYSAEATVDALYNLL